MQLLRTDASKASTGTGGGANSFVLQKMEVMHVDSDLSSFVAYWPRAADGATQRLSFS